MVLPTFEDILSAHELIKPYIHRTPVLTSKSINILMGCELFFKCENFQKVGAFKFRGATNAVFSLSEAEASSGVGTHSSGNHAAALALAARMRGIEAHIVMPSNAPEIKKIAVAGYGAHITYCEPTLQAREETLQQLVNKIGLTVVHPYNNFKVICGQGTAALELLEEAKELEILMCPVGGGGLLSGTALSTKALSPATRVIAAEPKNADDAFRSFRDGYIHPSIQPMTIADGLLTSLGEMTFAVIQKNVDEVLTAREETIVAAMRMIWERMKIIIEPSSAVPLAVIMENREKFSGKNIGIILSGGNVELTKLPF
ncbi:MAG: pyridoxal-phosphate dependent enzyme [Prolixibacteraceae bacterium]